MTKKRTAEIAIPIPLYKKTLVHSPGGASARGPCGPNAIHQAAIQSVSNSVTHLALEILSPDVLVIETYQLSFPAVSTRANQPSFCPSAASIVQLVLVVACPPISSLCRLMSDWISHGLIDSAVLTKSGWVAD